MSIGNYIKKASLGLVVAGATLGGLESKANAVPIFSVDDISNFIGDFSASNGDGLESQWTYTITNRTSAGDPDTDMSSFKIVSPFPMQIISATGPSGWSSVISPNGVEYSNI